MKRLLIILFTLLTFSAYSQIGIVNYDTIQSKAIQADSALWIKYLENGGIDTLLTHIKGKVGYVLPFQIPLTAFDSIGFRLDSSQIIGIDSYQMYKDTLIWDATKSWVLSQIPDSVENSNLHVEAGRLENLTNRAISVTFSESFTNQPIGEEPQIYRVENFKGNYRRDKLLWGWADASQPTTTGFSLNIDSSEPLANVVLEYVFVEIIKGWILEGGIWNDNNYWIDTEIWID